MIFTQPVGATWFCIQAQSKHEHVAAARLRKSEGIEVFLPKVRFQRATRQGPAWVTEALFPGYLFARFDWQVAHRRVEYASGVRKIVQFGASVPTVPDATIGELQEIFGADETHTINGELSLGDLVQIADGALSGLRAVITRLMPGQERVAVLMSLLGQETTVELPLESLIKEGAARAIYSRELGLTRP